MPVPLVWAECPSWGWQGLGPSSAAPSRRQPPAQALEGAGRWQNPPRGGERFRTRSLAGWKGCAGLCRQKAVAAGPWRAGQGVPWGRSQFSGWLGRPPPPARKQGGWCQNCIQRGATPVNDGARTQDRLSSASSRVGQRSCSAHCPQGALCGPAHPHGRARGRTRRRNAPSTEGSSGLVSAQGPASTAGWGLGLGRAHPSARRGEGQRRVRAALPGCQAAAEPMPLTRAQGGICLQAHTCLPTALGRQVTPPLPPRHR